MAVRSVRRTCNCETQGAVIAVLAQLATLTAEFRSDYNALLAKLDADAGVTDTNYVALRAISAVDIDTLTVTPAGLN